MPWFDDPATFYRTDVDETTPLSQGDIVFAPTATIAPGTADADVAAPVALDSSRRVTLWQSGSDELPAAPSLHAEVTWGLAMVLPHPCAMEKEWNDRVAELEKSGMPSEEALATANSDRSLDRYIAIAPVLAYGTMPRGKATSIGQGNRLGAFPVCGDTDIPVAYVDLNRITTVDYATIPVGTRLKALSELAQAHLQHRLAMYFAYRAPSKLGDVELAVGKRIDQVTCTPSATNLNVSLILEDGSTLTLTGDRRPGRPGPGPERPARS